MHITPDSIIILVIGPVSINATIFFTWTIMALLIGSSLIVTSRLSTDEHVSRFQHALEVIVKTIRDQIHDITRQNPDAYAPFLGTLFLFISLSNFMAFVPGYYPPTGSLNTTAALALCVFVAVPVYGIRQVGVGSYLKQYIEPVVFMLPFNIISELSRTLALAVRLFGNVMSGTLLSAIVISLVPFIVPAALNLFSLLIGQIHAYIFAILAAVYIASGTRAHQAKGAQQPGSGSEKAGHTSDSPGKE
ncbi:MAG: F0F1 ATP synthase subunit A [Chitinivibrionales bacterium]|nr:F0F1 ATP synthase subunit A [Chitinivibrionales bacterium]